MVSNERCVWAQPGWLLPGVLWLMGCGSGMLAPPPGGPVTQGEQSPGGARVLKGIDITPGRLVLLSGENVMYRAKGLYSDGTSGALTAVTWSSSSAAATIASSGLLETGAPGIAAIVASSGAISSTVAVEVVGTEPVQQSYRTVVPPLTGEDLAEPCSYEMLLPNATEPVRGMWVIFDRGDSVLVWQDPEMRKVARRLGLGLVYASQCDALTYGDVQSEGDKGPARALASALGDFARLSGHAEVAEAPLVLFGFSATAVLSITSAEQMPDRILTVVAYAPGSHQLKLSEQVPSTKMKGIPLLVLGNANDTMAGTTMGRMYFERGRGDGAPWAFAVQPGMPHCCVLTSAPILYAWLKSVVPARQGGGAAGPFAIDTTEALAGTYTCTPDGFEDWRGYTDCGFTAAKVGPPAAGAGVPAWIPDGTFGDAWLRWVGERP